MANLQQRSGKVHVRVGGNTQETAVLVDSLPDGKILQKDISQASNPVISSPLRARYIATDLNRADPYTARRLHGRSTVYDEEYIRFRRRAVVPRYASAVHRRNSMTNDRAGIPWNDTSAGNIRLAVADRGQEILGEYLIGLQAGNEPDLYARHGHRAEVNQVL